ncbi:MAG TPA: hypothetical protein PKX86_09625 [Bacteroidia bacterium]|jgi:hypothetical protein|nr:hypothetical protein [Saprospiraceae bacterium]HRB40953.1 hypothetical protein [Bacteroidia bacterium]
MATPNLSAAAAYGTKFAKGILLKVFSGLAEQGITVYTGIKGPTKFGKMAAGVGLKAYNGTFTAPGGVVFTDRQLTPALATYETQIQPLLYYNKWMADQIRANATAKDIPFENYMWQQITQEIQHELVNSVLGIGDTTDVSSNLAIRITDGFNKIIDAIGLTPVATGAITAANVITQLESVYESIPARYRKHKMNMYMSYSVADMYNKKYRELFHDKPTYNAFGQQTLDIGNGNCIIKPVEWITDGKIIVAPQENMVLGTDSMSDMNTIEMVKTVYGFDTAIVFSIGLQVPDPEFIWINDQF